MFRTVSALSMSVELTTSFWNLPTDDEWSPAPILRKQANALTRQTKGLLVGEILAGAPLVSKSKKPTLLKLTLAVRVPNLGDYRLDICKIGFFVHQKVIVVRDLIAKTQRSYKDIAGFEKALQACLGSEEMGRILTGLMTAAKATVDSALT